MKEIMNPMINYFRTGTLAVAFLLSGAAFTSCADDVEVGKFDDGSYEKVADVICMLRNAAGPGPGARTLELRTEELTAQYYIELSQAADRGVDLSLKIDQSLLTAYNQANGTTYPIFPAEMVSLEEQGAVLIAPGARKSDLLEITLKPGQELEQGTTYVLPLLTELHTEGLKLAEGASSNLLFVKMLGAIPSTAKESGIVTIAYVECNNNNILNAGEWRLAKSGKLIIDIVNIFAANVNYIEAEGRIGVTINPNVQHILDNSETYIRPLQAMGMRVCLTVMGNHDGTGVANLSDETAREFAANLKAIVDTYGLDGVDFDDEWSDYAKYPMRPGCVKRNGAAYSRLCYEVKRAMPDKLCTVYYVGACVPDPSLDSYGFDKPIEGMYPGDYVDYSYSAQYGAISEEYWAFLGMTRKQWGASSIDMGNSPNFWNLDYVRKNGYGVQVVYDLRTNGDDWVQTMNQNDTFNSIAKKLYDDTGAVWSGIDHAK